MRVKDGGTGEAGADVLYLIISLERIKVYYIHFQVPFPNFDTVWFKLLAEWPSP